MKFDEVEPDTDVTKIFADSVQEKWSKMWSDVQSDFTCKLIENKTNLGISSDNHSKLSEFLVVFEYLRRGIKHNESFDERWKFIENDYYMVEKYGYSDVSLKGEIDELRVLYQDMQKELEYG